MKPLRAIFDESKKGGISKFIYYNNNNNNNNNIYIYI